MAPFIFIAGIVFCCYPSFWFLYLVTRLRRKMCPWNFFYKTVIPLFQWKPMKSTLTYEPNTVYDILT
eukprot:UN17580